LIGEIIELKGDYGQHPAALLKHGRKAVSLSQAFGKIDEHSPRQLDQPEGQGQIEELVGYREPGLSRGIPGNQAVQEHGGGLKESGKGVELHAEPPAQQYTRDNAGDTPLEDEPEKPGVASPALREPDTEGASKKQSRTVPGIADADTEEKCVERREKGCGVGAGIVVAITSRCYEGRVLGVYAYEGGCVDLIDAGAITAGDMQGHKIRLLLMSALGRGMNAEGIRGLLGRL